jgi:hypothetical protein
MPAFLTREFVLNLSAAQEILPYETLRENQPNALRTVAATDDRTVLLVSYPWQSEGHPDPSFVIAPVVQQFLRAHGEANLVFWDFMCIPQVAGANTVANLKAINEFYFSSTVLCIVVGDYKEEHPESHHDLRQQAHGRVPRVLARPLARALCARLRTSYWRFAHTCRPRDAQVGRVEYGAAVHRPQVLQL